MSSICARRVAAPSWAARMRARRNHTCEAHRMLGTNAAHFKGSRLAAAMCGVRSTRASGERLKCDVDVRRRGQANLPVCVTRAQVSANWQESEPHIRRLASTSSSMLQVHQTKPAGKLNGSCLMTLSGPSIGPPLSGRSAPRHDKVKVLKDN
jgi:hypothetical protein